MPQFLSKHDALFRLSDDPEEANRQVNFYRNMNSENIRNEAILVEYDRVSGEPIKI